MKKIKTKYGFIEGISSINYYKNNTVRDCTLNCVNKLQTPYGIFIPQYDDSSERRKLISSLSFYDNGNLKRIALQDKTYVNTSLGTLPAELITFYEDESIKRIFNLNGKITGYWSEEDEYSLAENIEFNLSIGKFNLKTIGVHFYEDKTLKSITLWPKDIVHIISPIGKVTARIGLSFYSNGNLKSFEPYKPITIETKIGNIVAYDVNPIGIHGDSNSVKFSIDGQIESLITSTDKIKVINKNGQIKVYKPQLRQSLLDEEKMDIVPLSIEFYNNKIFFNNSNDDSYSFDDYVFNIESTSLKVSSPCSSCVSCSGCSSCSI